MALDSIVVDNTVFNFFLKIQNIDLSNILRNTISGYVFVPAEIVNEMGAITRKFPELAKDIEKLRNQISKSHFFKHCHSFDSVVLEFALKNIDKGEAEAISQCIKRRIRYFITDDFKCLPFITKNYVDLNEFSYRSPLSDHFSTFYNFFNIQTTSAKPSAQTNCIFY